jgi:hypothetical protein
MGGWQYFRKLYQGDLVAEIDTDNASKAQKHQRLLIFLVTLLPVLLMSVTRPVSAGSSLFDFYLIFKTIMGFFLIFYVFAMLRIFLRINQLLKK